MSEHDLPVTKKFLQLVDLKLVSPSAHTEELRFPGQLPNTPTIAAYNTGSASLGGEGTIVAELEQRSSRNIG